MRRLLTDLLLFAILFTASAEAVFRFLIPVPEGPNTAFDPQYSIVKGDIDGNLRGTFSIGRLGQYRRQWQLNNEGWIDSIDYQPTSKRKEGLVVLIGDSYIQGLQVSPSEHLGGLLRHELLPERQIYRVGWPHSSLAHYKRLARYAVDRFDPDTLVFLVVEGDMAQSLAELDREPLTTQLRSSTAGFVEIPIADDAIRAPSFLGQTALSSATFRYLVGVAGVRVGLESIQVEGPKLRVVQGADLELERSATSFIMRSIAEEYGNLKLLVVADADRRQIYDTRGDLRQLVTPDWKVLLEAACQAAGVEYLDLTPTLASDYAARGRRFDFPTNYHWNPYGHQKAAEAIRHRLFSGPLSTKSTKTADPVPRIGR